jgi:HlyD family secretion protein
MLQKTPPEGAGKAPETEAPSEVAAVLAGAPRRSVGRRIAIYGAIALVAVAGLWFWLGSGSSATSTTYTTQPVTQGDLTVTVTATGTVEPTNQVAISSELSGTVREVLADYNDTVKKGEVLARLDTDKLNASVALARATLAARRADVQQAQATADEAAATLSRTTDLAGKGLSAQQALDSAKAANDRAVAALASANASLQIAQANLTIAETDLTKAEIISPIDGVVLTRTIEVGQIVAASFSAPELFSLAEDLTKMQLEVDVDEADMGKVKTGDTASFTVEAFPNQRFPAEISLVRYSPETVEGVVTYKAILTVDNSDLVLRPGMTATADITVETVKDATQVPNAALRYSPPVQTASRESGGGAGLLGLLMPRRPARETSRPSGGRSQVWVLRDGSPVAVPVKTGATDGTHTAVTGELKAGDQVIVGSRTAS